MIHHFFIYTGYCQRFTWLNPQRFSALIQCSRQRMRSRQGWCHSEGLTICHGGYLVRRIPLALHDKKKHWQIQKKEQTQEPLQNQNPKSFVSIPLSIISQCHSKCSNNRPIYINIYVYTPSRYLNKYEIRQNYKNYLSTKCIWFNRVVNSILQKITLQMGFWLKKDIYG